MRNGIISADGTGAGRRVLAAVAAALTLTGTLVVAEPAQAAPRATSAAARLQRVEAIADATGFDWRGAGGEFVVGCAPSTVQARCTKGAYVTSERRMYISPRAFATTALLQHVVLHELAHLWQFTTAPRELRAGVMAPFGLTGLQALESGADCLALHWGAGYPGLYGCPEGAQQVVGELYAATVG